jgi:hypothetical protein
MFQTDDSWACLSDLGAILNEPGLRSYRFVEVGVNAPLFHVDFHINETLEPAWAWSRFVCTKLTDALELIGRNDIVGAQLSIQTPRNRDGYMFFPIEQIAKSKTQAGDDIFVILGAKGERYVDGPKEELELSYLQIVWTRAGR